MNKHIQKIFEDTACEQKDVKNKLELWQYLPVIETTYEAIDNNSKRRSEIIVKILEDIALDAWKLGERHAQSVEMKLDKDQK